MDYINNTGEEFLFLRFILIGILIFALFRGIWYLSPLILRRQKSRLLIRRYLPLAETLFWVVFLSWFSIRFAVADPLFGILILFVLGAILFWLSKFGLKDMIAGMLLRLTSHYKTGDLLQFSGQEGRLKNWTLLAMELETSNGEVLRMPYSKIISESQLKTETKQYSSAYHFSLTIISDDDPTLVAEKISQYILKLPWSSVHQKPEVVLMEHHKDKLKFQISCYPLEKAFSKRIEEKVIEQFVVE